MKRTKKISETVCNVCNKSLESSEDYADYGAFNVHVHRECLEALPAWMKTDPEFFIQAVSETQGMPVHPVHPEHPDRPTFKHFIKGTTRRDLYYVFMGKEDEPGWICMCNNLKSIEMLWRDMGRERRIEGVFHNGEFKRLKVKLEITLE